MIKDTGSASFMPRPITATPDFSPEELAAAALAVDMAKTKEAYFGRIPVDERCGVSRRPIGSAIRAATKNIAA